MANESRLAAIEAQLEELHARHAIWDLMARYARAMDEEDNVELAAIYTPDATCETVPWSKGKVFEGRDAIVKLFNGYQARFKNRKRFITNERIHLDGPDAATGWSNWLVMHANDGQSYVGWGSYDWAFSRLDGEWLVSAMVVRVDSMTTLENGWANLEETTVRFPSRPK